MSKSSFDPRLLEKYSEPKSLLHFQWGDDEKVYRYALVEIINEDEIDEDMLFYVNIINNQMITKQDNLNDVLKEILLHEKYNS
mgnify:CR=1 FL=1